MNFLRRLALQEENLDDSSRLDVVEIAGVADMLPKLVSFLFGLRDLSAPVILGFVLRSAVGFYRRARNKAY